MTTLTTLFAELEEAERAATPGPWENSDGLIGIYIEGRCAWSHVATVADEPDEDAGHNEGIANARLIALMRTHLPALIEAVKRQGEALEPFAMVAEHDIGSDESDTDRFRPVGRNRAPLLTVGDFRRARAALKEATDV